MKNTAVTPIWDGLGIWRFQPLFSLMRLPPLWALNHRWTAIAKTKKIKLKTQKTAYQGGFPGKNGPSGETRTPGILLPNAWTKFFVVIFNEF